MADVFLDSHKIGARLYSIGGKLVPIAIRDQMIRGQLFVDRAVEAGFLKPDDDPDSNPLIVIGAGAGGVTAAIWAVERYGVRVILAESGAQPFTTQANCQTRWLSPNEFDFPTDHWIFVSYPPPGTSYKSPLAYSEEWSHQLAINVWRPRFQQARQNPNGLLEYLEFTKLESIDKVVPSSRHAECELATTDPQTGIATATKVRCALVLLAVGPGREKTYLLDPFQNPSPAHGFRFWQDDPFELQNLNLPNNLAPRVLISGSGDGALQDFLRLTLQRKPLSLVFGDLDVPTQLLATLMSAEQRAQRALHWGRAACHDHAVLDELHQAHSRVVDELLRLPRIVRTLPKLLRDPIPSITLLHECTHFSACYALNRFLTLLIVKYLKRERQLDVLLPQASVKSIDGVLGHYCSHDAGTCHGEEHEVVWMGKRDCRELADPTDSHKLRPNVNVLILRHGLDLSGFPFDPTPPYARHLLPYYLLD